MSFIKENINKVPIADPVFSIVEKANAAKARDGEENVVDATIGTLYGEDGKIIAFDSVFKPYDAISKDVKAAYASSFTGNPSFRKQVYNWVLGDVNSALAHSVVATPGASGAISVTMSSVLEAGETVILPEIAWGSYKLMAEMSNLKQATYQLFDGNHFNLDDFKRVCREVMAEQERLFVVINDPCQNPTGYSLSVSEWEEVVVFLNECGEEMPVVLLNDIAYIDYAYDLEHSRDYMETFNQFNENVMAVLTFSCSKGFTSYGLRCGAAIILAQHQEAVREVEIILEKEARAIWSNIPNAAMENFTYVTTENYDAFMAEKSVAIDLLKKRSDIFVSEANACGLPYYPYKEGFFVTLEVPDTKIRDQFHAEMMNQNIFTVKSNKGIRVAVCSLSVESCHGLAPRMKQILDDVVVQNQ